MNNLSGSGNNNFERLFRQHKNSIYNYALMMTGNKDNAGDIAQEVFLRLFEQVKNNSHIDNIKSWLFIIARNLCLNHKRDHQREIAIDIESGRPGISSNPSDGRIFTLRQAIQNLDSKYREALILKEYQGFSYMEIAAILNTTIPAIKSILFRARVSLREEYDNLIKKGELYGL